MFSFRRCQRISFVLWRNQTFLYPLCHNQQTCHYQINGPLLRYAASQQQSQRSIRYYTKQSFAEKTTCWNCKNDTTPNSHMICIECGHIQDVDNDMNYFDLLECPKSFDLKTQQLTQRFRQLQAIVHPDKFSNKSEREQNNSADWSSLINKAYKTLLTPIERGQYLLELHGVQLPEDNSALDKEFLMEMMERNEEVDEATTEEQLRHLDERIVKEMNEKITELIIQFNANDLKAATAVIVQMKYLRSMQRTIKTKLQSLNF